jgi:hypothetical protein
VLTSTTSQTAANRHTDGLGIRDSETQSEWETHHNGDNQGQSDLPKGIPLRGVKDQIGAARGGRD